MILSLKASMSVACVVLCLGASVHAIGADCTLSANYVADRAWAWKILSKYEGKDPGCNLPTIINCKHRIAVANAYLTKCFNGTKVPWEIKQGFAKLLETKWSYSDTGRKALLELVRMAQGNDISFGTESGPWGRTTITFFQEEIVVNPKLKGDIEAIAMVLAHEGCHAAFGKMKHIDVYREEIKVFRGLGKNTSDIQGAKGFYIAIKRYSDCADSALRSTLLGDGIDPDETRE